MSFWMQLLMWAGLVLVSLTYLGYLMFRLVKKGSKVFDAAKPVIDQLVILSKALQPRTPYEKPETNLLDDVNVHIVERAKMAKTRKLKAELRQRRLIEHLKDFNSQESELNNGRP